MSENKDFWYHENNEEYILRILQKVSDKSAGSDELANKIRDWSTEYQFSPKRTALLLPFTQKFKGKTVLEIGAGMGVITRYLGENAKSVVAIEPSSIRVEACEERCSDLDNVKIQQKEIGSFETKEKFDFVMLIGVLEYAGMMTEFSEDPNPHLRLIEKASSFLKKDGELCIAIENKLSTKYFLPNREDHTAIYSESLHDFPNETGIKTFSKDELKGVLEDSGLSHQEFFYPFPDYKTPTAILSDLHEYDGKHDISPLLFNTYSQEYYYNRKFRYVDELLLLSQFYRANILRELANSFLVFSSKTALKNKAKWTLKRYNSSKLRPYRNEITLTKDYQLEKHSLLNPKGSTEKRAFINGDTLGARLHKESLKQTFAKEWAVTFKEFIKYLDERLENETLNPTQRMETHPDNVMIVDGKFVTTDIEREDIMEEAVSRTDIILRALFTLFTTHKSLYREYNQLTTVEAIKSFSKEHLDMEIAQEAFTHYLSIESKYTALMTGNKEKTIRAYIKRKYKERILNTENLLDLLDETNIQTIIEQVAKHQFNEHLFELYGKLLEVDGLDGFLKKITQLGSMAEKEQEAQRVIKILEKKLFERQK